LDVAFDPFRMGLEVYGEMEKGTTVTLLAYKRQLIDRVVVSYTDTHVNVCRSEEWEQSLAEDRHPAVVGFHKSDIVQVKESRI
jgi:hypothetical protein